MNFLSCFPFFSLRVSALLFLCFFCILLVEVFASAEFDFNEYVLLLYCTCSTDNSSGLLIIVKKECASYLWKSISQLRSVTCRMGSHSVTCHPTQANTPRLYPSQTGLKTESTSVAVTYRDGLPTRRRSPIQALTRPDVE